MSEDKVRYFQGVLSGHLYEGDDIEGRLVREVQVVPLDAIVIPRDELPKVTTGSGRLQSGVWAEGRGWDDAYIASAGRGALATRAEAIARKYLAVAEHLREHPPVDEAQVEVLADLLSREASEPHDWTTSARRLVERGVRVGDA